MKENYYISERTSIEAPMAHKNADIFYLPINVMREKGMYKFNEYRIDTKKEIQNMPTEVVVQLAESLNEYRKILEKLGDKMNEIPEKLGYKWKPVYVNGKFQYELMEDENAIGTEKNPIIFEPGILIKEFFWYTDGTDKYVGIKNGFTDNIEDTEFLTKFE